MSNSVEKATSEDIDKNTTLEEDETYERPPPMAPRRSLPPPSPPTSFSKPERASKKKSLPSSESMEFERPYDWTPVAASASLNSDPVPTFAIDPWEKPKQQSSSRISGQDSKKQWDTESDETDPPLEPAESEELHSTFILPGEIHPNMEHKEEEIARLRLLAGKLSADWRAADFMAPALARRVRDFQFAQEKRRKKYGDERPWGILGLYDYLSSIRIDVEWAEDAAHRRSNGEPYLSWADFDESKKGRSNRPVFTYLLLFICTVALIASFAVNDWKVESLANNPMIGPSAETLIRMGAKDTILIVNEQQAWRLLSSTILHAGLVHYFINMLALWFVGAAIEMTHGWIAAMTIFTLSAVGGTILSAIFLPDFITVGASGGIFGFIGACLADILMNWKLLFCDVVNEDGKKHRHAIIVAVLLLDIILNSIIGLTPFVDNFTHLGGMIYGFLCALSTIERLSLDFFGMEEGWFSQTKSFILRFAGLIITLVAIAISAVILFQGDGMTTPCPSCTWLSCVPFPPWAGPTDKWWYCDDCGRVTAELISAPVAHLELYCPKGTTATIDLSNDPDVSTETLKRNLPTYCREFCPSYPAN